MRKWGALEAVVREKAMSDLGDGTVNHKMQGEVEKRRVRGWGGAWGPP